MQRFAKIKSSVNGEITLSFTDIGKSCQGCEFLMSQLCISRENYHIYYIHVKCHIARNFMSQH